MEFSRPAGTDRDSALRQEGICENVCTVGAAIRKRSSDHKPLLQRDRSSSAHGGDRGYREEKGISSGGGCVPKRRLYAGGRGCLEGRCADLYGTQKPSGATGDRRHLHPGKAACSPVKYGGTGRESGKLLYAPGEYDYEPGTQNLPGIAALKAGSDYICETGVDRIFRKEREDITYLLSELERVKGFHLFGPESSEPRGPVLSFGINGLIPADISYILKDGYGIIVREGLQCAPLIHECIGSGKEGTVRVSISYTTKRKEMDALIEAVQEIGGAMSGADKRD